MRFVNVLLVIFLLVCLNSFSENFKTEWITNDVSDYTYKFWVTDNDSVAISIVIVYNEDKTDAEYELQYWDIATKTLIKKAILETTYIDFMIQLNTSRNEFFHISQDSIVLHKLDDYNYISKIPLPIKGTYKAWYDYSTNLYCTTKSSNDTLFVIKMNPDKSSIYKIDTLIINNAGSISYNISDNGAYFTINNGKKSISIYDSKDCKLLATKDIDKNPNIFKVSNSGKYLCINTGPDDEYPFRIYDLTDNSKSFLIDNHILSSGNFVFTKNEKQVLIVSSSNGIYLYDMFNQVPKKHFEANNSDNAMYCLEDNCLVNISKRKILNVTDINTNEIFELSRFNKYGMNYNLLSVRFLESNENFLASGGEGIVSARNNSDGKITNEKRYSRSPIKILNQKGKEINDTLILFVGNSSKSNLIYYKDNEIINNYSFDGFSIGAIAVSNDNKWFVGQTYEKGTFLYNLTNEPGKKKFFYLDSGRMWSEGAAFSSDSRYLATGGTGNILKVYDLNNIYNDTIPIITCKYMQPDGGPFDGFGIRYIRFIDNDTKIVTASSNFSRFMVWSAITGDTICNPLCPTKYAGNGNFFTISNIEYRKKYDDYVTSDIMGTSFIWDKNFNFKSFYTISNKLGSEPAVTFDYNQTTNQLLIGCNSSTIALVKLDGETDVDEIISNNYFDISPNPAADYIEIKPSEGWQPSEGSDIQIFNTLGEIILSVEQTSPSVHRINISKLTPGMYFIKIGNKVEKFVKI